MKTREQLIEEFSDYLSEGRVTEEILNYVITILEQIVKEEVWRQPRTREEEAYYNGWTNLQNLILRRLKKLKSK